MSADSTPDPLNSDYFKQPEAQGHLKVLQVLQQWDPIGVCDDSNNPCDEYDAYAPEIIRMLDAGMSCEQIVSQLGRFVTEDMGLCCFDQQHTTACVKELIAFWLVWKNDRNAMPSSDETLLPDESILPTYYILTDDALDRTCSGDEFAGAIEHMLATDDYASLVLARADGDRLQMSCYKQRVNLLWHQDSCKVMHEWPEPTVEPVTLEKISMQFLQSKDDVLATYAWRSIGYIKASANGLLILMLIACAAGFLITLITRLWP